MSPPAGILTSMFRTINGINQNKVLMTPPFRIITVGVVWPTPSKLALTWLVTCESWRLSVKAHMLVKKKKTTEAQAPSGKDSSYFQLNLWRTAPRKEINAWFFGQSVSIIWGSKSRIQRIIMIWGMADMSHTMRLLSGICRGTMRRMWCQRGCCKR